MYFGQHEITLLKKFFPNLDKGGHLDRLNMASAQMSFLIKMLEAEEKLNSQAPESKK